MPSQSQPDKLLSIYLNDHLAGATAGVQLARRLRGSNRDEPGFSGPLGEICAEIETDREILTETMERLGISRGTVKPAAAWLGEKLGRLKPNGQLTGSSPLSRVIELELLLIGVTGKLRMWRAVELAWGENIAIDFGRLSERAERQRSRLEELHDAAVHRAFASTAPAEQAVEGGSSSSADPVANRLESQA
jgi:hypothetical protein